MNKMIELNHEQIKELAAFAFSKYEQFQKAAMTHKRHIIRLDNDTSAKDKNYFLEKIKEAEEAASFWSGIVDALTNARQGVF